MKQGFGLLDPRKKGCAGDADDICNGAVRVTGKAELAYAAGVRHQLVQPLEKLFKNDAVGYDGLKVGRLIRPDIAEHFLLVVERKVIPGGAVFADRTVSLAEPPAVSGARATLVSVGLSEGAPDGLVVGLVHLFGHWDTLLSAWDVDGMLSDWLRIFLRIHGFSSCDFC